MSKSSASPKPIRKQPKTQHEKQVEKFMEDLRNNKLFSEEVVRRTAYVIWCERKSKGEVDANDEKKNWDLALLRLSQIRTEERIEKENWD